MTKYCYTDLFSEALNTTSELGFSPPPIAVDESTHLFDEFVYGRKSRNKRATTLVEFVDCYERLLRNESTVAFNCYNVCINLQDKLAQIGYESHLTVGYVNFNSTPQFYIDKAVIIEQLNGEHPECKGHCWLTLPSMEIIDPTFLATYFQSAGHQVSDIPFLIIARHWSQLTLGTEYIPVVVGNDYIHCGKLPLPKEHGH